MLASRLNSVGGSATLAVQARASEMIARGIRVANFCLGEPDFDTPISIKEAAWHALKAGDTKYPTPVAGTKALRSAICEYFQKYNGLKYELSQIIATVGAKDAIYQAMLAVLEPEDEVVIPVPYWVSYPEQAKLCGAKPVLLRAANGGNKISPDDLAGAITPKTKLVIINSPSNPSGLAYSRSELAALAAVLRDRPIWVLSDELYHRLTLHSDEPATSIASIDGMIDRTITVCGMSKTYAMTGWRLGFAGGPAEVISAMTRIQGQTTSGPTSFVQSACVAALSGDQRCVEEMRAEYRRRAERVIAGLRSLPGVTCDAPHAGFVAFPDVSAALLKMGLNSADEFAERALEQAHVAIMSGSAFGSPQHIRFSFAANMEEIELGLARLSAMMNE
jgi:aspartate aminotransferase